jgi:hypothetical protein
MYLMIIERMNSNYPRFIEIILVTQTNVNSTK